MRLKIREKEAKKPASFCVRMRKVGNGRNTGKMKEYKGNKKRVVVAMSGGVDSSVAAALLKKQGFDVIGVFMKLWAPDLANSDQRLGIRVENKCCNVEAMEGARRVTAKLKIPFYTLDLIEEFRKYVVDYYLKEYLDCRTPNPCVICNKFIKFDFLLKKTKALGADYLATGHYAKIGISGQRLAFSQNKPHALNPKRYTLLSAIDKTKDQTYFLWTLTQKQLSCLLFPIGDYKKEEVRALAKKWALPTAERAESQGLCFIGYWDNREFLEKFIKAKPGPILDKKGNILGEHKGLPFYTIGQRRGLGELKTKNSKLKTKKGERPPLYVLRLDQKNNALVVGEEKELYQKELFIHDANWINPHPFIHLSIHPFSCQARIRYGHPVIPCRLLPIANRKIKVTFEKPVRAITPGQSIVFYLGEKVLGGGIIS